MKQPLSSGCNGINYEFGPVAYISSGKNIGFSCLAGHRVGLDRAVGIKLNLRAVEQMPVTRSLPYAIQDNIALDRFCNALVVYG